MVSKAGRELDFSEACQYLALSPKEFSALREENLVAFYVQQGRQVYPLEPLTLTERLLTIGQRRGWNAATVAWYADLLFCAEIGRAILLPIHDVSKTSPDLLNWLGSPYASAVLEELADEEKADAAILSPLRSLITVACGESQFWPDNSHLERSAVYPIVTHFESSSIPVIGQGTAIARDVLNNYALIVLAFDRVAAPISNEFNKLVWTAGQNIKSTTTFNPNISPDDKALILRQPLIPVDKLYASKATEIHSPAEAWGFKLGVLETRKRTIALEMKLPTEASEDFIDNIISVIRPYLGAFGARVVQLLYEVANDPPYFRHPVITVEANDVLDRLGLKRDRKGFHRSKNRERLRDVLNAAHNMEIVGEYTEWENGKLMRKALRRTLLSLIGAAFDAEETQGLSTSDLFLRGLPKTMQIRLNFYDGVRRPDGKLGNQFVFVPRLAEPQKLAKANYVAKQELLKSYLLFRYRQTKAPDRVLSITRKNALDKAGITTKNITWATRTLNRALDKLVAEGTVEHFSEIPLDPDATFQVVLSEQATYRLNE